MVLLVVHAVFGVVVALHPPSLLDLGAVRPGLVACGHSGLIANEQHRGGGHIISAFDAKALASPFCFARSAAVPTTNLLLVLTTNCAMRRTKLGGFERARTLRGRAVKPSTRVLNHHVLFRWQEHKAKGLRGCRKKCADG